MDYTTTSEPDKYQQMTVEELQAELEQAGDTALRSRILRRLGWLYQKIDLEQSERYAREALALAESIGNSELIVAGLYVLASGCFRQQKLHDALEYVDRGITLVRATGHEYYYNDLLFTKANTHERLGECLQALVTCRERIDVCRNRGLSYEEARTTALMGVLNAQMGNYQEALEQLLRAQVVFKEQEYLDDEIRAYVNIAYIYECLLNYEAALSFAQKALELQPSRVTALQIVGACHLRTGNPTLALEYMLQAGAEIRKKHTGGMAVHTKEEGNNLLVTGEIYHVLGHEEKALMYFERGLAVGMQIRDPYLCYYGNAYSGGVYHRAKKYELALQKYQNALSFLDRIDNVQIRIDMYRSLSEFYEETGEIDKAFEYYKRYTQVRHEISGKEKQQAVAEVQAKFNVQFAEREKELLQIKNTELASALDEVRRLNEDLTLLNAEQQELLGIVAHDLKSPLAGVRMVASLLQEHCERMPVDELRGQLRQIVDTSDRMLAIATGLLQAQQVDSGSMYGTPVSVDLPTEMQDILEEYRRMAQEKQITIAVDFPEPLQLVCSREALRQAVENIVSNAVKFTSPGGRVSVSTGRSRRTAFVEVRDEGPGIALRERRKLYGKYTRLSARPTGGESSTGLGLWIAKRAVEALSGRIRCSSTVGKGTTFRIELPVNRE